MKEYKNKKILVTGGAGFVGSNLTKKLIELEADVTVFDDLFTGDLNNLPSQDKYSFVQGSVTNKKMVNDLVKKAEIIFHLAARNIIASTRNPIEDFETNIGGTLNILMASKESNAGRVIYTSSASIFGNPRHLPITEDERFKILSPYAASKLGGENYCTAFYESYDLSTTILRYSNIYGVMQNPSNPYCGVIAKFIEQIENDQPVIVHGNGEQTRDFTYVDDAVEATLISGISKKSEGETFNIGSGVETSILKLISCFEKIYNKKIEIQFIDRRDIDNIRRRVMNTEKIRSRLKWIPKTTHMEGLIKTVNWYKNKK